MWLAYGMLAVAVGHVAVAFKHRWIDGHDVIRRVRRGSPFRRRGRAGLAVPRGLPRVPGVHDGPGQEERESRIMADTHSDCGRQVARGALSQRAFLGRAASFGAALAEAPDSGGKPFLTGLEEHFATSEMQRMQGAGDKRLFSGGGRKAALSNARSTS